MNKNYVCNNRKCLYHDTTMIMHCARSISAEDDRPYALVCREYMPPERVNEGCLSRLVGVCNSPFHPEWRGKECQCVTCQPVGYCVEDPCEDCTGPVDGCEPPDDDDDANND